LNIRDSSFFATSSKREPQNYGGKKVLVSSSLKLYLFRLLFMKGKDFDFYSENRGETNSLESKKFFSRKRLSSPLIHQIFHAKFSYQIIVLFC